MRCYNAGAKQNPESTLCAKSTDCRLDGQSQSHTLWNVHKRRTVESKRKRTVVKPKVLINYVTSKTRVPRAVCRDIMVRNALLRGTGESFVWSNSTHSVIGLLLFSYTIHFGKNTTMYYVTNMQSLFTVIIHNPVIGYQLVALVGKCLPAPQVYLWFVSAFGFP